MCLHLYHCVSFARYLLFRGWCFLPQRPHFSPAVDFLGVCPQLLWARITTEFHSLVVDRINAVDGASCVFRFYKCLLLFTCSFLLSNTCSLLCCLQCEVGVQLKLLRKSTVRSLSNHGIELNDVEIIDSTTFWLVPFKEGICVVINTSQSEPCSWRRSSSFDCRGEPETCRGLYLYQCVHVHHGC